MFRRVRQRPHQDAELDITSFMNLMIILVPVLLMTMVFSHITVLDLKLPDMASADASSIKKHELELVITDKYIDVNYPAGIRVKRVPRQAPLVQEDDQSAIQQAYDYHLLSDVLQEVKRQLKEKQIEKRNITILSQANTPYQTLVSVIDIARSFKTVVATSVVDAELFPEISLGDAPDQILAGQVASVAVPAGGGR
ncbi:hypothetical protein R50073_38820 [Maricurvus nonylphenolicus]|uniref:ExbD/TolR family protein n=1 Tax=Maricurvus nonylphenolicus TaxID=1008307 RepID=UPI0036F3F850